MPIMVTEALVNRKPASRAPGDIPPLPKMQSSKGPLRYALVKRIETVSIESLPTHLSWEIPRGSPAIGRVQLRLACTILLRDGFLM